MYRMNAQSRAIEEKFLALRHPLPDRRRHPVLPAARGQGRAGVPAGAPLRHRRSSRSSGSSTCPARGIGDKSVEALRRYAVAHDDNTCAAIEAAAAGRGRGPGAAHPDRDRASSPRWSRRLRTRIGVLPLPELLDEVLEASGYRAMLADGSEEGEDRWANLLELRAGDDPLRRPVARTTRSTGCSRRRRWSPTRTRTRARRTRSR